VHHPLKADVGLAVDDGPQPWLYGVEGYHHTDLTPVQVKMELFLFCSRVEHEKCGQLSQLSNHYSYDSVR
jgi:hypothetical protein